MRATSTRGNDGRERASILVDAAFAIFILCIGLGIAAFAMGAALPQAAKARSAAMSGITARESMKRRPSISARRDGEAAFTLVEVCGVIAVIALLSIVGLIAIAGASKAALHAKGETAVTSRLLHLEALLRRQAALVEVPSWAPRDAIRSSPVMIEVPYFRGDPAAILRVGIEDGFATVETAEIHELVGPFPGIEALPLLSADGRRIGIQLTCTSHGAKVDIKAVFSSASLPREDD